MEKEPLTDPPHDSETGPNPTDRPVDEEGNTLEDTATVNTTNQPLPAKPAATDTQMDANLDQNSQANPTSTSDNPPSGSDPTPKPSVNRPKSAFVKIMELDAPELAIAWISAFFDHYIFYDKTGVLHGDISPDTIIYIEKLKRGGLLHLDPPVSMTRRAANHDGRPIQRWIAGYQYDDRAEVVLPGLGPKPESDREPNFGRK